MRAKRAPRRATFDPVRELDEEIARSPALLEDPERAEHVRALGLAVTCLTVLDEVTNECGRLLEDLWTLQDRLREARERRARWAHLSEQALRLYDGERGRARVRAEQLHRMGGPPPPVAPARAACTADDACGCLQCRTLSRVRPVVACSAYPFCPCPGCRAALGF